ncbi:MAG: glycosyltransferase family 2 protein [Desertimonas sp.]
MSPGDPGEGDRAVATESPDALTVSAVMPFYNGGEHLGDAVGSVIAQTRPPDELIIVDDGSTMTDGLAALADLTAPFPIRVVHQANAGQSAARNHGVAVAKGEVLAFLDQDDRWHRRHLEMLLPPFEDPDVGWSYSDFDEIDAVGRTVTCCFLDEHGIEHPKRSLAACLAGDLMVLPTTSVIRRTTFDDLAGFDPSLRGYEDDDLFVRCFRSGWTMVFIDRSLAGFRVHATSSSANTTFAASRMRFSDKLRRDVPDDRRLNRYYFRDLVAPRFFRVSVDDYVRAVSEGDWAAAIEARAAIRHFGLQRRDGTSRWKLALIDDPRRFRALLQIQQLLPARLRVRDPLLRLR